MIEPMLTSYKQRIGSVEQTLNPESKQLMLELLEQIEQLSGENERLRKSILKQVPKATMSSKLKDALYE
ncbi:hypothetical protein [Paenibacillus sp. 481]|uniref:hypothetical protein n=1 Tax=Paenibacillus sp. 481 TaxID=2835869 RepID=UPI001E42F532|nr:hypothetical protein [Paenibacillus sp. 481]UHA73959.1 hypothetical protein KIK04_01990 [Paenibacillus sp. 481]